MTETRVDTESMVMSYFSFLSIPKKRGEGLKKPKISNDSHQATIKMSKSSVGKSRSTSSWVYHRLVILWACKCCTKFSVLWTFGTL